MAVSRKARVRSTATPSARRPPPLAGGEERDWAPELFDLSPDLLCVIGADGFFKRLNPAWETTLGFSRAELMLKPFIDFVHPDDRDGTIERAARITASEPLSLYENRYACRDGSYRWVAWAAAARTDPPGLFAVGRDITDQKRAAAEQAESEEVFRTLFEQASVGIVLDDIGGAGNRSLSRENGRIREMLGVDELTYSVWVAAVSADDWRDHEEQYARLLAGQLNELRERRELRRPDGTTIWVDLSTILVRDLDGQPSRSQTMALDVTEQVEAEQRLLRRGNQQAVLLELSQAGLEGLETAEFLSAAIHMVARGTEAPFATILEVSLADDSLTRVAAHGCGDPLPTEPAPLATSARIFRALESDAPVLVVDYTMSPEFERNAWMTEAGVVTSMGVGIKGPIHPFGVLSVHSDLPMSFNSDDVQFLQLASTIISVAVERKRAEKQRRLLLGRLVTAQEVERRAIAEDIHDDAVQVLTAANIRLELFRRALTDPVQIDAGAKLQDAVVAATGRLRRLLFELNPPDLERHGLAVALRQRLEQLETDFGVAVALESDVVNSPPQEMSVILFRIFQEALANVRKHARASSVLVSLAEVDGGVLMRLKDDGVGFLHESAEPMRGHLGLASMRERAEMAGGWLRLSSRPGAGTEISTWVPSSRGPDAAPVVSKTFGGVH